MDIFLVPVGGDGYELYCEIDDGEAPEPREGRPRWRQKASAVFHRMLRYIETERRSRLDKAAAAPRTRVERIGDRAMAWLAERVAEQRLLWQLRSQTAATAHYPDDLTAAAADAVVRDSLRRDSRRHLRWAVVHTVAYLAALPLSAIPGPNFLTFFFSFRALGHLLSWMGARQGLRAVAWQHEACPPLTRLRGLAALDPAARVALAREVAAVLQLQRLDTFVARMTLGGP